MLLSVSNFHILVFDSTLSVFLFLFNHISALPSYVSTLSLLFVSTLLVVLFFEFYIYFMILFHFYIFVVEVLICITLIVIPFSLYVFFRLLFDFKLLLTIFLYIVVSIINVLSRLISILFFVTSYKDIFCPFFWYR